MSSSFKKILKIVIPIGIGVFLIGYSLNTMSPDSRAILWKNIKNANPLWVAVSLILGLLSHLSRAYRWKFLLEPLGCKPKLANSFMAVMVAYLANLGIPRSGEILRGVTIANYENINFQKAFGTIISERVADLIMLLVLISLAFILQSENLLHYFDENQINPFYPILILAILIILAFAFLRIIKKAKHPFLIKIRDFSEGIIEGVKSILKMEKKGLFIFHTLSIWILYVFMFWVIKFSITGMAEVDWGTIIVAFVAGTFSMSTTNGGLGLFPYPIVVGAVFVFSGVAQEQGEAFGWVIWGAQTLFNIVIGGLCFIMLPIYNRKLKNTA